LGLEEIPDKLPGYCHAFFGGRGDTPQGVFIFVLNRTFFPAKIPLPQQYAL